MARASSGANHSPRSEPTPSIIDGSTPTGTAVLVACCRQVAWPAYPLNRSTTCFPFDGVLLTGGVPVVELRWWRVLKAVLLSQLVWDFLQLSASPRRSTQLSASQDLLGHDLSV